MSQSCSRSFCLPLLFFLLCQSPLLVIAAGPDFDLSDGIKTNSNDQISHDSEECTVNYCCCPGQKYWHNPHVVYCFGGWVCCDNGDTCSCGDPDEITCPGITEDLLLHEIELYLESLEESL